MASVANTLLGILGPEQRTEVCKESINDDEFRVWSDRRRAYCHPCIHFITKTIGCAHQRASIQVPPLRHAAPHGTLRLHLFGHHLAINVVAQGGRVVIGPTFMGAEPDRIDEGPHAGLPLFTTEEIEGLNLMRWLAPELQEKAQLSKIIGPEGLPEDRWNPFDERRLGGARQDNRIVPYEDCPVSLFTPDQTAAVMGILKAFNIYLPAGPLAARLKLIEAHLDETYFAWIGGYELSNPYYFRLHSPVAFCEFDFHCGIAGEAISRQQVKSCMCITVLYTVQI
ncbi:hypothetical protein K438DRAFT_1972662 [Mycena galopus ATCC 62051]|nr:hypothetical protein K438DRAFT_1972662 [Mycena galopus ATCC 62051]